MEFALMLYGLSLTLQLCAALAALFTAKYAGKYLFGWVVLSLALLLMTSRRIAPMIHTINTGQFDLADAMLSVPISFLLLLGVFFVRRNLIRLQSEKEDLVEIAQHDSLTGLYNHAVIILLVAQEIARNQRFNNPTALIMIDIDDFKLINDMHGHQTGDLVLQSISEILNASLRQYDAVGRYGGEEFLLLLPQTETKAACEIAERLRIAIADLRLSVEQVEIKVTVSMGISILIQEAVAHASDQQNIDSQSLALKLIAVADEAMYQSKTSGKNKCTCVTITS